MRHATAQALTTPQTSNPELATLLEGYRFSVCQDDESFARCLDVRREVYVRNFGYDVPVPDAYDHRAWLLMAEHIESGETVGTMRILPRAFGPIEAEEYFRLPAHLDSKNAIEISRFAILPAHRKTRTFYPIVSLGLFRMCYEFVMAIGSDCQIVCSKPAKLWTYQAMGFTSTGITARYESLNGAEHELLQHDLRNLRTALEGNPFSEFFLDMDFDEVALPDRLPAVGFGNEMPEERFLLAVGA